MDHGGQTTKANFEMWNYEQKGALSLPRDCLHPSSRLDTNAYLLFEGLGLPLIRVKDLNF